MPEKKAKKLKFKPEISRVRLNPEQAVLTCYCFRGPTISGWPPPDLSHYSTYYTVRGARKMNLCSFGYDPTYGKFPINTYELQLALGPPPPGGQAVQVSRTQGNS